MDTGDVYFNGGNKPTIRTPLIAKNRKDARLWLVAQLLIRESTAENIQVIDTSTCMIHKVLIIKQYRRYYSYKGKHYTDIMRYPESRSGRLTQMYD